MFSTLLPLILVTFGTLSLCQNDVLSTLPTNFTLNALNVTLPNANSSGVPLVLGQNGATGGVVPHVTSTYASFPYNDYPVLALVDNTLRAYRSDGTWNTNATEVQSGGLLSWVTTTIYAHPAPMVYSALSLPDCEYPVLSAHGFWNLWSLCPFDGFRGQNNVVFNVSANIPPRSSLGYDPSNCYSVTIQMIPIS